MKILMVDRYLKGRPNANWKEGFAFYYAAKNLGIECDIAGKDCDISEWEIPNIASNYDLIIISENYPHHDASGWWNWKSINTKKVFWAIDTHIETYNNWIKNHKIDYVAFNNYADFE